MPSRDHAAIVDARFVEFEGAFNVRDLGGLPTTSGATVRPDRVYRADGPHRLTMEDHERIRSLDVATVIDLRSGDEAGEGTWAVDPSMSRHLFEVIDVIPEDGVMPDLPPPTDIESFAQRYLHRIERGATRFADAARTLTDSVDEGVIFHCSAGKDRTGLLAAFVLSALDVDRELVVADYAASNDAMSRRIAYAEANPIDDHRYDLSQVPPILLESPAPVMARLLELTDEQGGIAAMFKAGGFDDDDLGRLRKALLV